MLRLLRKWFRPKDAPLPPKNEGPVPRRPVKDSTSTRFLIVRSYQGQLFVAYQGNDDERAMKIWELYTEQQIFPGEVELYDNGARRGFKKVS